MPKWSYRIRIRQYLTEDQSKESMLRAVNGIREEVRKLPPGISRYGIEPLKKMHQAAEAGEIDWFNASLGRLYDFFDEYLVWVELS